MGYIWAHRQKKNSVCFVTQLTENEQEEASLGHAPVICFIRCTNKVTCKFKWIIDTNQQRESDEMQAVPP